MLIYTTGLNNIPKDLTEAASIDGAGTLARFRHITVPMRMPSFTICIFYDAFQMLLTSYMNEVKEKKCADLINSQILEGLIIGSYLIADFLNIRRWTAYWRILIILLRRWFRSE